MNVIDGKTVARDLLIRAEVHRQSGNHLEEAVFCAAAHLLDPELVPALRAAMIADCRDMPGLTRQLVVRALEREKDPRTRDRLLTIQDSLDALEQH